MTREDLIRQLLLSQTIADDYDEIDRITECVTRNAAKCGVEVTPNEVRSYVWELLNHGLAKAYLLSTREPYVLGIPGVPSIEELDEYYFLLTEKGIEALNATTAPWPFDEDDNLLPGWSLSAG